MSRLRAAAGAPVERVVQAAHAIGLSWTPSWILAVEQGQRALNGEQLLALPMVLSAALARRITLADLLAGDGPVLLSNAPVAAAYLREVVVGNSHKRVPDFAQDGTNLLMATNAAVVAKMQTLRQANLGDVDVRTLGRAEAGSGSTEVKLARRLNVPEIVVIGAAASLWGRSLSDERDAQLRDNPTLSATTVNRRLTAEVTKRLAKAGAAGRVPRQVT